jgi:hypothetical protein
LAKTDVVSPGRFTVVDPVRTKALRRIEALKVHPVFLLDRSALAQGEARLRLAFTAAHMQFKTQIQDQFDQLPPLRTVDLEQPRYLQLIATFRAEHAGFPLTKNLADLWALGDSGEIVLDKLLVPLHRAATNYIANVVPVSTQILSIPGIQAIAVDGADERAQPVSLADLDREGISIASTHLLSLAKARRLLREAMRNAGGVGANWSTWVPGFLQANCLFHESLTEQRRNRHTRSLTVADRYEPGQVIVRRGDPITPRVQAALDAVRDYTEPKKPAAVSALAQVDQAPPPAAAASSPSKTEDPQLAQVTSPAALLPSADQPRWSGLSLGLVFTVPVILAVGLWWGVRLLRTRQTRAAGLPLVVGATSRGELHEMVWRDRALAAEARAEKATAMLKARLFPHLAGWMMKEVIQRFLTQRSEIVSLQEKAEKEVSELAQRLEGIHTPLEERLRAYERRIAQLEAELESKGEQNQELIQAKIKSTREKLKGERSREPLTWN